MRALVQRVESAEVRVDGRVTGAIDAGLLVLLGIKAGDTAAAADWLANKCANLRIFPAADGTFDRAAVDVAGDILVVSQFTLYGDCRKGRRPDFTAAARPAEAEPLYEAFVAAVRATGLTVATGEFGAMMSVALVNDGPVTVLVESKGG